jgi:hypothetical protein
MFKVVRLFAFLLCFIAALPASAVGSQTGVVTTILNRNSDGLLYFYMSGSVTGRPACATISYWIIKDENSNSGKKLFALLLLARQSGQEITVKGAGTCTRWGDGEDVDAIVF